MSHFFVVVKDVVDTVDACDVVDAIEARDDVVACTWPDILEPTDVVSGNAVELLVNFLEVKDIRCVVALSDMTGCD